MAADPKEEIQLTRENVVAYREWLGALAAQALYDIGEVRFFIDEEGDVRIEVPSKPGEKLQRRKT
jgi:hypothetical protein